LQKLCFLKNKIKKQDLLETPLEQRKNCEP
jgi:hypothetical protein